MTFTDEYLKRLKDLMNAEKIHRDEAYELPWTPIVDLPKNELSSINDANGQEVITCDGGYYGPGVMAGEYICELVNNMPSLLARLEAAESCAELLKLHQESGIIHDGDEGDDALAVQAIDAWRKAAGK